LSLFDRSTQDVGNIVELGHVNVRVPDQSLATLFYVVGLGLTRDPYMMVGLDNMWVNAGASQFHLPTGAPQVLRGVTGLVLPDLDAAEARLDRLRPALRGSSFTVSRDGNALEVLSPWGNRIRCHAPDENRFGPITLGMPYVEIDAAPGSAAGIARFYREVFGAPARVEAGMARITAGVNQHLVYRETRAPMAAFDGHHVQITLAVFSAPHPKLQESGLITEESNQSQYRFESIRDLASGRELARVEHEVRSMHHPQYRRPLINRHGEPLR
jgi:catechol 2,3-dioxygenase-like lactoylglutathione lyase family enzyme